MDFCGPQQQLCRRLGEKLHPIVCCGIQSQAGAEMWELGHPQLIMPYPEGRAGSSGDGTGAEARPMEPLGSFRGTVRLGRVEGN